jgi:hypothetical protein
MLVLEMGKALQPGTERALMCGSLLPGYVHRVPKCHTHCVDMHEAVQGTNAICIRTAAVCVG